MTKLEPEMGVIGTKGIIGITTSSSEHYTYVKPIIHEDFVLEVIHEKSKSFGFVKWTQSDDWRTATVVDIPNYAEVNPGTKFLPVVQMDCFLWVKWLGTFCLWKTFQGDVYLKVRINLAEDFSSVYNVLVVRQCIEKGIRRI